jgi:beta-lactamase superfamily II metal-dependent hydrolase
LLAFHILNVGHGDSIVVEYSDSGARHFGLVDSCAPNGHQNAALSKLKSLGASRLSFLAITHPHADHFTGVGDILDHFSGNIDLILSFPVSKSQQRIKRIAEKINAVRKASSSATISRIAADLIKFLALSSKYEWQAPTGMLGRICAPGFTPAVEILHILPPSKVKGSIFTSIDQGHFEPNDERHNDLSLAMIFKFAGHSFVLGADGAVANWLYQERQLQRAPLSASGAKLPHHGSQHDCSSEVIDFIFGGGPLERIAVISADGRSHPHEDVLADLARKGIKPYCTGLATVCGGNKVVSHLGAATLPPPLRSFIQSTVVPRSSPCQGDIAIFIDRGGKISVDREYSAACTYRGDFAFSP